ncbi:hypothetical protein G6F56_009050 [Rhizopus delemar]|nr:hypothetical protein G6F56_009050 [Rhizopus delemar]
MKLTYTPATLADLDIVSKYEEESYHPDEAASKEQLRTRIGYASHSGPELFMVARDSDKIAGFLCSTLTHSDLVTDESMSAHEPEGRTICLHSVCVAPDMRKRGIATDLLKNWIAQLKEINTQKKKYDRIAIMSRPSLMSFYENVGFVNKGQSKVVHGPEPWIDCVLEL